MAEIVRRRSWGGVLPLGRQASISGSSLIQCASDSIALSSFQEGQNARNQNQFKLEQALNLATKTEVLVRVGPVKIEPGEWSVISCPALFFRRCSRALS